jgi:hypothetical protein
MARASSLCDSGGHFKGIINGKEKPTLRTGKSLNTRQLRIHSDGKITQKYNYVNDYGLGVARLNDYPKICIN